MTFSFANADINRKLSTFKGRLWADGFYTDSIVCKIITTATGSGFFDRSATTSATAKTIQCIAEYGPSFVTNDNVVETINADVRLTVRLVDASSITNASELWISDIKYKVKSRRPAMFGIDEIFLLTIVGK